MAPHNPARLLVLADCAFSRLAGEALRVPLVLEAAAAPGSAGLGAGVVPAAALAVEGNSGWVGVGGGRGGGGRRSTVHVEGAADGSELDVG